MSSATAQKFADYADRSGKGFIPGVPGSGNREKGAIIARRAGNETDRKTLPAVLILEGSVP
ncbi:hypothetical protein C5Y96_02005 [Blastopirellula marina]|uniref:Uncharacterized protein n=1 Tax=Blastopirellula marina TaxID=124 RepID=A0A2S8G342_9BACT|nr:hypothetical protein C5Y96_02005 [Blastopirellula marina]RCS54989.1 hypothetical protein DTL36_02010 [Bremerella cremea]